MQDLSPAEWEIMMVCWEHGPLAARDVYAHLKGRQEWSYGTVRTLLARTVKKGWLTYDQIGNSYLYKPAVPRQRALQGAVKDFVDRVLGGALSPFVAYLAERGELSDKELDEIQQVLRDQRRSKGR
jgi:predicted transcriptional regulator